MRPQLSCFCLSPSACRVTFKNCDAGAPSRPDEAPLFVLPSTVSNDLTSCAGVLRSRAERGAGAVRLLADAAPVRMLGEPARLELVSQRSEARQRCPSLGIVDLSPYVRPILTL